MTSGFLLVKSWVKVGELLGKKKSRFVRNKADFLHFRNHELIGEVRIGIADKPFRAVA